MYLERPLKDFIEDTSSRTPTPGGGSVAALVGALGGALLSMVGNFTLGKKKFESVQKEIKDILQELNLYTSRLCELIQDDISAYQNFSRISSLPKNTQQERKIRMEAMEKALKNAAEVPLKTADLSLKLIKLASRLVSIGNPNLISDVGVGAILAEATLESAALNVEINLSYIKDAEFIKEKRKLLTSLLDEGKEFTLRIVKEVREKISPAPS
ncbi:cyclodeaminase/cyclohydrolase family protein [Candidatus Aerophobetes bacterium]|nr:cyclodeaminase/cyclohydrolase family protein [Candidatus Aerophobetes bacterium]